MLSVKPVIRYMILCNDWASDPANARRIDIFGLLTNINSLEDSPYPLLHKQLSVVLVLSGGRGSGEGHVAAVFADTGQVIFAGPKRTIYIPTDPLEVTAVGFRMRNCVFYRPGLYLIQFWYNGNVLEERPLRLR